MFVRGTSDRCRLRRVQGRGLERAVPPAQGARTCPPASGEANGRVLEGLRPMRGSLGGWSDLGSAGRSREDAGPRERHPGSVDTAEAWLTVASRSGSQEALPPRRQVRGAPEVGRFVGRQQEGSPGGRRLERSRLRSDRSRGAPDRRSTDRAYAGAQLATYVCSATRGKGRQG